MKSFIFLLLILVFQAPEMSWSARIKDISSVTGVKENQLIGYGLVVGLNKTGDQSNSTKFTVQSLVSMMEKMGTTIDINNLGDLRIKNVAAVMVTAILPPFARVGMKIDITVSSLGDAKSLAGGTLLLTPLRGANGKVYAVAQGGVSIGGAYQVRGRRGKKMKNHTTVGKISGGALVEREVPNAFLDKETIRFVLNKPDFKTVWNLAQSINKSMGGNAAQALDSATVEVTIPENFIGRTVELMASLESLNIEVDVSAKVVMDERTGTIVIGKNVKLGEAAISHGNLTITIESVTEVIQPPPLSGGQTVVIPTEKMLAEEQNQGVLHIPDTTSITELVKVLNAIGVSTRDLIAILQALKSSGSLQAELEVI